MSQSVEDRVLNIMAEVSPVPRDQIQYSHNLRTDLRMDSVSSMELVSMLCEEFDIDIDIEEAMQVETVQAAIDMTQKHLA